jgi:hypothetical protein
MFFAELLLLRSIAWAGTPLPPHHPLRIERDALSKRTVARERVADRCGTKQK